MTAKRRSRVIITSARAETADGAVAATIDRVAVGGGEQIVTVDGTAETRVHASSVVYHVRLITPGLTIPDELRECGTYEEACAAAEDYAAKLDANAGRIAELAADLKA